jgi:hypothetical protein
MDWQKLKEKIYYLDGSFRDIYIHNTTKEDWIIWADFVNENYKTSFHTYGTEVRGNSVDLNKIFEYWKGALDNCSTATVFIHSIQVNAHFFTEKEIENDITPKEFNSIEDHKNLLKYMSEVSKALNKRVELPPENNPEFILISVDSDEVKINVY